MHEPKLRVAVVDYGMGNLFSVEKACEFVGLDAAVTASSKVLEEADAIILPGVGAFGDAMQSLKKLDLIESLRSACESGKPVMGICLGMQLLMERSEEFGEHAGLAILKGNVIRFESAQPLKVPHIGWETLQKPKNTSSDMWSTSPLSGLPDGTFMYFVHSYFVKPAVSDVILSMSSYGGIEFCSSLLYKNIFACQYHPERSGPAGLQIYTNFVSFIRNHQGKVKKHVY